MDYRRGARASVVPMPGGTWKGYWFVIVALLGGAAIGIEIGLLVGYALDRLHRGEGRPKPLPCPSRLPELLKRSLCCLL